MNKPKHKTEAIDFPPVISGFDHINRYWDKKQEVIAAKILPGEFYVSCRGEMIVTVLGSCVSACIRDVKKGVGGMNHFMLPHQKPHSTDQWGGSAVDSSTRYGNWAMEFLINEILKQGGTKKNLEIKIFGGGKILKNMTDIGDRNIKFVTQFIFNEGLQAVAEDLGDIYARKVLYFSDTGSVKLRKLKHVRNDTLIKRELEYSKKIDTKPTDGDVDLF